MATSRALSARLQAVAARVTYLQLFGARPRPESALGQPTLWSRHSVEIKHCQGILSSPSRAWRGCFVSRTLGLSWAVVAGRKVRRNSACSVGGVACVGMLGPVRPAEWHGAKYLWKIHQKGFSGSALAFAPCCHTQLLAGKGVPDGESCCLWGQHGPRHRTAKARLCSTSLPEPCIFAAPRGRVTICNRC